MESKDWLDSCERWVLKHQSADGRLMSRELGETMGRSVSEGLDFIIHELGIRAVCSVVPKPQEALDLE